MIMRAKETYRGFLQDFYSDVSELDKIVCHYANTDHHHDFSSCIMQAWIKPQMYNKRYH